MKFRFLMLAAALLAIDVSADNSTLDAAIGGGLGGAVGAAIGNEVGGRDGAIIGGALGGGVGAAINTDEEKPKVKYREKDHYYKRDYRDDGYRYRESSSRFCPPGQAKKGRC